MDGSTCACESSLISVSVETSEYSSKSLLSKYPKFLSGSTFVIKTKLPYKKSLHVKTALARGGNKPNLIAHFKVLHPVKHEKIHKNSAELQQYMSSKTKGSGQITFKDSIISSLKYIATYDRKSKKLQKVTDAVTYSIAPRI